MRRDRKLVFGFKIFFKGKAIHKTLPDGLGQVNSVAWGKSERHSV